VEIKLSKRPKSPTIIEGFPGFGLVGTIATEFLIEHLETEMIGKIMIEDMPAIVAIHENKVVQPLGVFYNKKYNLVILHAINSAQGMEWKMAEAVKKLAVDLEAKEIICIEGVGTAVPTAEATVAAIFFYTNNKSKEKILTNIAKPLKEGIIMGVTGALLLRVEKTPLSCIFAETHSEMPDSKAAAEIVKILDKYLDLKLDPQPLMKQAEKFEEKLKTILTKSKEAEEMSDKKKLSYVG
jgi:uncharacterized protein